MAKFLFLLYSDPSEFENISPEEIQQVIQAYQAWAGGVAERGNLLLGHKLKDGEARNLVPKGNEIVVDGPFSETKEFVGGFYLIQARDYDEAVELCSSSPHLTYGGRIEIREIDPL